jgi:hypothetical protein
MSCNHSAVRFVITVWTLFVFNLEVNSFDVLSDKII